MSSEQWVTVIRPVQTHRVSSLHSTINPLCSCEGLPLGSVTNGRLCLLVSFLLLVNTSKASQLSQRGNKWRIYALQYLCLHWQRCSDIDVLHFLALSWSPAYVLSIWLSWKPQWGVICSFQLNITDMWLKHWSLPLRVFIIIVFVVFTDATCNLKRSSRLCVPRFQACLLQN